MLKRFKFRSRKVIVHVCIDWLGRWIKNLSVITKVSPNSGVENPSLEHPSTSLPCLRLSERRGKWRHERVVQESRSRLNERAISRVSGATERGSSGLARPESKGKTKKRAGAGALNISRRINSGNLRHKFWSAWDILFGEREYSGSARRRRRCSRAFLARASKMASARWRHVYNTRSCTACNTLAHNTHTHTHTPERAKGEENGKEGSRGRLASLDWSAGRMEGVVESCRFISISRSRLVRGPRDTPVNRSCLRRGERRGVLFVL